MLSDGVLRQIILITDGHSNRGGCPVAEATAAAEAGITVSAIGILDTGGLGAEGQQEVERIAAAGGGTAHFIQTGELAHTIYTVTRQATRHYVARLTGGQLQDAAAGMAGLSPRRRSLLIPLLEEITDKMDLHVVLVIDTSGSMNKKKWQMAEGIRDVLLSLSGYPNQVKLAILRFPAGGADTAVMKTFDSDNAGTTGILRTLGCGGQTPTGPAIKAAVKLLTRNGYQSDTWRGNGHEIIL